MRVIPGQLLSAADKFKAGEGTFEKDGFIYSSLLGTKEIQDNNTIAVTTQVLAVPFVGSIITSKHAIVQIILVNNKKSLNYSGTILKKDIRKTNVDQLEIYKCYRPGDVVRCLVTSIGDGKNFVLSTAGDKFGVVLAVSLSGYTMVPVSWDQMVCPHTGNIEFRKCAKPE
ncbi:Exosome complex component CSL4 [Boothiomyces sp. JEL0866]|nr:Exosome complex component CSL4 [Boothiomyces sp. JEL0866]